ncbi:MAG: signal recognition particle protein [Phycisphaerales bacterium]
MFSTLTERFNDAFRKLSGRGRITEENVSEAMREVRTALLEADVHYEVVKKFTDSVVDEALGAEVTKSLKPGQQMIGIVHRKLVELMGPVESGLMYVEPGPTVIMMCGLQGSGKTTTCGKLAGYLKRRGKSVMVAAADLQRPAAVEQLRTVTKQVDDEIRGDGSVHFYAEPEKCAEYGQAVGVAVGVCRRALEAAKKTGVEVLILDTAGRLHVNDELMGELRGVNQAIDPHQILLIVDAMSGQDAVNSAKAFHEQLAIDGVILTKFDSDTRGGAALSVKEVTGAPIKFIGVGEHLDALEEFHPERMAGRILGMGDVVSLVERAQLEVDEEEAEKLEAKMAKGELTMDDFLAQLKKLRRMGPLKQLLGFLPGLGSALKDVQVDDHQLNRLEGIINSMTLEERRDVKVLNTSRRKRVAAGSGTDMHQVSQLTKQFDMISKMSRQLAAAGGKPGRAAMRDLAAAGQGGAPGSAGLGGLMRTKGSTKMQSPKAKGRKRKGKGKRRK